MGTETLERRVTASDGGDNTVIPPNNTRFPGGDDDESRRKQTEEEVAHLDNMFQAPAASLTDGRRERARDVHPAKGYTMDTLDSRHAMSSRIGKPAVSQFFDFHEASSSFSPDMQRGIGSFVARASYRF